MSAPICPLTLIAWRLSRLSVRTLWERYVELGGNHPRGVIAQYLAGTADWGAGDHNVLVQAINEALWDLGHPTLAPYRQLQYDRPTVRPESS